MANRFNQYQSVDYVNLPIDHLHAAVGANEAESLAKLTAAKASYDAMDAIQAIANPDVEMKHHIMNQVNSEIGDLAKKNLKGSDVLLQLSRIINNPSNIDKLAGIYGNTQSYDAKLTADKKYQEDYGNDINTLQSTDEWDNYNKQGMAAFKPGMLRDYSPGKFVDVVGEIQKTLNQMKDDGWGQMPGSDGKWIRKGMREGITLERALATAGLQLQDPKYAAQLKKLGYSGLRNIGLQNGVEGALNTYKTARVSDVNNQISAMTKDLAELKTKAAKDKKFATDNAKTIEDGQAMLDNLIQKRGQYQTAHSEQVYQSDMLHNLAEVAATPYIHMKSAYDLAADPYGLARYKSDLEYSKWKAKWQTKKDDEAKQKAIDEFQHRPVPVVQSIKVPGTDGNVDIQTKAIQFTADGGYNVAAMSDVIAGAMNKGDGVTEVNAGKTPKGFESLKKSETVKQGLASGKYQIFYVPSKNQYMLTTPDSRYLINPDQGMQAAMGPLVQMFNPDMPEGTQVINDVSLDGMNTTPVIMTKKAGKDPGMYVPVAGQTLSTIGIKDKDWKAMTGMTTLGSDPILSKPDGLYIVVEGEMPMNDAPAGAVDSWTKLVTPLNDVMTPEELQAAQAKGYEIKRYSYVYKNGTNLQTVEPVTDPNAFDKIISNHVRYETRIGGRLNNITSPKLEVKAKNNVDIKDDQVDDTEIQ